MSPGEQNCLFHEFTLILPQILGSVSFVCFQFGWGGPSPVAPAFLLLRGTVTLQLRQAQLPFTLGMCQARVVDTHLFI